jgi:hypothetical protein
VSKMIFDEERFSELMVDYKSAISMDDSNKYFWGMQSFIESEMRRFAVEQLEKVKLKPVIMSDLFTTSSVNKKIDALIAELQNKNQISK